MACNKGRPETLRKWDEECMKDAYNAVKNGNMSISGASKAFNVPRMTLSDRVNNKVPLEATMGVKPALNAEDESALYSYIEYLANRGFPLTIPQILGFAWCIATERGKANVFSKDGPSHKCGIYPFNPNAVDKTLLLRSSTETDPYSIDLSVKESDGHSQDTDTSFESSTQSVSNLLALSVPEAIDSIDSAATYIAQPLIDMSLQVSPNDSYQLPNNDDGPLPFFNELNLSVGENGILDISSEEPVEQGSDLVQECPPELAFSVVELGLTPRKKRKYEDAFSLDIDLQKDNMFQTWKSFKLQISTTENHPCESSPACKVERSSTPVSEKCDPAPVHPLVRAGLIPVDLADVLVVPTSTTFKSKTRKSATKARVLTNAEVQQEIEEKERQRKENEDAKEKRKLGREKRKNRERSC